MWAYVRKHGAIGMFYAHFFHNVSTKDEWFNTYSEEWELHHFLVGGEYVNIKIPEDTPR